MKKILLNKFQIWLEAALSGWFFTTEHCILLHIKEDILNLWRKIFCFSSVICCTSMWRSSKSSVFSLSLCSCNNTFMSSLLTKPMDFHKLIINCITCVGPFQFGQFFLVTVNNNNNKKPKYPGNKWHCWPRCAGWCTHDQKQWHTQQLNTQLFPLFTEDAVRSLAYTGKIRGNSQKQKKVFCGKNCLKPKLTVTKVNKKGGITVWQINQNS